ncbi:MAG: hypothetical protein ABI639_08530 [Thermoanaerobaculia bacterium]
MPRLTDAVFKQACRDAGVIRIVEVLGEQYEVSPKLNEIDGETWTKIRNSCALALALPADWEQRAAQKLRRAS